MRASWENAEGSEKLYGQNGEKHGEKHGERNKRVDTKKLRATREGKTKTSRNQTENN